MIDPELDPDHELTDEDTERIMARYELDQLLRGHVPPSFEVAEMESRRWLAENFWPAHSDRGNPSASDEEDRVES